MVLINFFIINIYYLEFIIMINFLWFSNN
jgi:hypothetical protein